MTAWRYRRPLKPSPATAEARAAADVACWAALSAAAAQAVTDPANASFLKCLARAIPKAFRAKPPPPAYVLGSVWFDLMDLARQFMAESTYGRLVMADRLRLAVEACALFLDPPAPPGHRPRADIDG